MRARPYTGSVMPPATSVFSPLQFEFEATSLPRFLAHVTEYLVYLIFGTAAKFRNGLESGGQIELCQTDLKFWHTRT